MHVLLALAVGIIIGHLLRSRKAVLAVSGRATTGSVWALVFFLGVSVGANQTVMRALGTLGMQALVLALGGVAGSVMVSALVSRWFLESTDSER